MTYNEKKSLYESIMKDVAKIVKRKLNESDVIASGVISREPINDNSFKMETKYGTIFAKLSDRIDWRDQLEIYRNGVIVCKIDIVDNDIDFDFEFGLSSSELKKLKRVIEYSIKNSRLYKMGLIR